MPRRRMSLLLLALVLAVPARTTWGGNWPMWRGPLGDGHSAETDLPLHWSATENIAWKAPLAYTGHSSPIVWDDVLFVTGVDEANSRRMLVAIDRADGSTKWEQEVLTAPLEKVHKLNSRASSTPATDGQRVYVSFLDQNEMFIAAYDFAGNKVWESRPGPFKSVHGYCSSPVVFEDLLIVNGDHDGDAYLVALDRATGKTVWKTPRENR
ncbi:MAG: PQQ-binding-like beta-propeller repeat protein, partial [Planctomycetaceae bacterium]